MKENVPSPSLVVNLIKDHYIFLMKYPVFLSVEPDDPGVTGEHTGNIFHRLIPTIMGK